MTSEFCLVVDYSLYIDTDIPNVYFGDRTDDELRFMQEYGILDTWFVDTWFVGCTMNMGGRAIYFDTKENMVKFQLAYLL